MVNKIIPYNPKLKEFARILRKNSTLSEILLWKQIKNRALGVEFHRQVPMLEYIIDFYCHELRLAIEVDGNIHDFRYLEDAQRQGEIEKYGVTFIRFSNEEVKYNMFSVILSLEEKIKELQKEQEDIPLPPSKGELG
ncbi:endonuclease domain-containing protein [Capnocytophaga stomatis]|uniref:Endonuclease domain-containing protein n=1 Tax=Capnocytophaga stomatis TaxID=1848904 RepID=A0ABW8QD73_9FLAO